MIVLKLIIVAGIAGVCLPVVGGHSVATLPNKGVTIAHLAPLHVVRSVDVGRNGPLLGDID